MVSNIYKTNDNIIIENINKYMNFNGITKAWLSNMIDKSPVLVGKLLNNGYKKVDLNMISEIADIFGFTLEELKDECFEEKFCKLEELSRCESRCVSFYEDGLTSEESVIIDDILNLMDIINSFKKANELII